MPSSKQLIQDTAVRLFNERGYDKVSLGDIAREAGVAIGSLTYHFRRKEDLLDAILAGLHGSFEEALDRSLRGGELLANLVGLFAANEANQERYPFYFADVTQVTECSAHVAEEARRFEGDLYAYYRWCLVTLAEDGILRQGHTTARLDALAYALVTMQASWAMGAGPYANEVGPKTGVATALAAILSACLEADMTPGFEELCAERGIRL
jgi:AcrR family transcriptional regulator